MTSLPQMQTARPLPAAAASLRGALTHAAKVRVLQALRLARWLIAPGEFAAPKLRAAQPWPFVLAAHRVSIARRDLHASALLEEGKRANLQLAARAFDGLLLAPGEPLSFHRVLGRMSERRGYQLGLEISAGCLVPAIGGGVCLLANALFETAARAGLQIVERHGHTMEAVPPRAGELWGIDATVFWPYVDLRFAAVDAPVRLGVRIEGDELVVELTAQTVSGRRVELFSSEEHQQLSAAGLQRMNRVHRRIVSPRGELIDESVIAENRRRLLAPEELSRTCLTCHEAGCHRRPSDLEPGQR